MAGRKCEGAAIQRHASAAGSGITGLKRVPKKGGRKRRGKNFAKY